MHDVLVLKIQSTGKYFCSGFDINQIGEARTIAFDELVNVVEDARPVTIAVIQGGVYGGATDLVLACDLRISLPGLVWRMPACALGLHYYPGGLRRYLQAFGSERARQLFLTADTVTSEQLQAWGVLMALVEPALWSTRLSALAQQVAALAPLAAQGTKASLRELAAGMADEEVLRARESVCAASEDFHEGRQAMAERRSPVFKGR
jgi:enoyl-CoA hydratase/carnithine racemase